MQDKKHHRPVALSLFKLHYPVTAIASILHRITGVILVLGLLPAFYLLNQALISEGEFAMAVAQLHKPLPALFSAAVAGSYFYHLASGVRHLLMDMGIGEDLRAGRISAWLVLGSGLVAFLATLSVLLW